jgi:hypothetical protein
MASIFCCSQVKPYHPQHLDHEQKFRDVMDWASFPKTSSRENNTSDAKTISEMNPSYAMQIVRQVNYGPLESKRYFIAVREKADEPFLEVTERDLIEANYEKLNSCVFSLARSPETFFFREVN